jgi:hypothetical protein
MSDLVNKPDPDLQGDELPTFRFALEKSEGRTLGGSYGKEATVKQLPISKGIAGVSMRLEPGVMRELHWHATAAEWAFVLEARCRTTVLDPQGRSETHDFDPGDICYFPRGPGTGASARGRPARRQRSLAAVPRDGVRPGATGTTVEAGRGGHPERRAAGGRRAGLVGVEQTQAANDVRGIESGRSALGLPCSGGCAMASSDPNRTDPLRTDMDNPGWGCAWASLWFWLFLVLILIAGWGWGGWYAGWPAPWGWWGARPGPGANIPVGPQPAAHTSTAAVPGEFLGKTVTVSGKVDHVYNPHAFTLAGEPGGRELLVIDKDRKGPAVKHGETVQVTGKVEKYGTLPGEGQVDLNKVPPNEFNDRPVVVATTVRADHGS